MKDRLPLLRERARIIAGIRAFFGARGYLPVETPRLCPTPIPESHIDLFRVEPEGSPPADTAVPLYLLPSPEYYLKRLIAAGSGSVYEIARCFRDSEETGAQHLREFTMLEYYTIDADSHASLELTRELLRDLGVETEPLVLSMDEAWRRWAGISLTDTFDAAGAPSLPGMRRVIERGSLPIAVGSTETWEDLFQRVFLSYVEPELPGDRPVFLTHYPAAVPTLARRVSGTPWADRWEMYLGGAEIANCFGEETDPGRIAGFFDGELAAMAQRGQPVPAADRGFLQSPRLPACSGVAMGIDRLVMALTGVANIGEVVAFDR